VRSAFHARPRPSQRWMPGGGRLPGSPHGGWVSSGNRSSPRTWARPSGRRSPVRVAGCPAETRMNPRSRGRPGGDRLGTSRDGGGSCGRRRHGGHGGRGACVPAPGSPGCTARWSPAGKRGHEPLGRPTVPVREGMERDLEAGFTGLAPGRVRFLHRVSRIAFPAPREGLSSGYVRVPACPPSHRTVPCDRRCGYGRCGGVRTVELPRCPMRARG
jgi:hypothetical protein